MLRAPDRRRIISNCFTLPTTRMSEVVSIQFTQDQARTLTGVSVETVRHWRKTVPYLSSKTGKAARFTFAELLGLAVAHELVHSFGVHIATLSTSIDELFRMLATSSPALLEGTVVFITATEVTFREVEADGINKVPERPAFMVPLAPLMAGIQRHMLPAMPSVSQKTLPFPPEVVRSRA